MPNTKSAIKKVRQDKKRTVINRRWRQRVKGAVAAVRRHPSEDRLRIAQKELDKAAQRNVIKKGKAARLKSRLARSLNAQTNKNN